MMILNNRAEVRAKAMIVAGDFTDADGWSFSADDSNKLLGDEENWVEFSMWFLGSDPTQPKDTKAAYAYPYGKRGVVYLSALRAIISRAGQNNAPGIGDAASKLLELAKQKMQQKTTASGCDEITLTASATIHAAGNSAGTPHVRRFDMTAYTGAPMKLKGWSNPVVVDLTGVSGAGGTRPIFLNHDEDRIVGHADKIDVGAREIHASGAISGAGDAAREVLTAHDNGFPWQASVGMRPDKTELLPQGQSAIINGRNFNGPLTIARKTTLGEISFVPLGADDQTSVAIAATKNFNHKRNHKMENQVIDDDPAAGERQRCQAISAALTGYPNLGDKGPKIVAQAISEGWTEDRAHLEMIQQSRGPIPQNASGNGEHFRGGMQPDQVKVIEAAMCLSNGLDEKFLSGHYDERTLDAATSKPLQRAGLHTLMRTTLRAAGRDADFSRMDNDTIRATFEADRMLRASGGQFSTMSLPGILSNFANKFMLQSYNSVPVTWKLFCSIAEATNFKPQYRYRLIGNGQMAIVPPTGELSFRGLQEQDYTNQIHTEGCIIGLSRQAIINDDLGAFTSVPKVIGRMGAIALERAVFTLVLANSNTFFSSDNGNYQSGGGSALNTDSLTGAEQLFLQQVDDNGDPILVMPKVLLVPPSLNVVASQLTRSAEIRDTTASLKYPTGNPHIGRFTPAVSPWLENANIAGNSATGWYLFADPGDVAAFEVAFLGGQLAPTIQSGETDFDTLGIKTRGFFDFGVAQQDYRAGVFSAGV